MPTLAREFNISLSTVHDHIEEQRKLLRAQTIDLAKQEREQALQLIDTALQEVMPHIDAGHAAKIRSVRIGAKGKPVIIQVEEWEAKMNGCEVMVKLLDRKAKLLSMDAPVKSEVTKIAPPETPEQQARAREALRQFTNFAPRAEDFQGRGLE
jgi:hypothetical protein